MLLPNNNIRLVNAPKPFFTPGAPAIDDIRSEKAADGSLHVSLTWAPSQDADDDLLGYRVFVSHGSRSWNYDGQSLPLRLMPFKSSHQGWTPAMYARRFSVPPADVALHKTAQNKITLELRQPGDYYVTVMPFDAHGEQVGKVLYPMSEEIVIHNP